MQLVLNVMSKGAKPRAFRLHCLIRSTQESEKEIKRTELAVGMLPFGVVERTRTM